MVTNVVVQMGKWKVPRNFIIVLMEEFEDIMELEWADKYMAAVFGKGVDQLLLQHDGKNVMVDRVRSTAKKGKAKVRHNSSKGVFHQGG